MGIKEGDSLPMEAYVIRICRSDQRDRENKQEPALSNFILRINDTTGLSVDWEEKTSPEDICGRYGASFKHGKRIYKDMAMVELYKMAVSFTCGLDKVSGIIYDPIVHIPRKEGTPDNPAHSLVQFINNSPSSEDAPEVARKIRAHAIENGRIKVDIGKAKSRVQELQDMDKSGV